MSWDVIGHEWAERLLGEHIRSGKVRHAYLFTGAPGVGRRTLALRFTQALNCPTPPEPGQPCRVCRTCQQIERMEFIDLSVAQSAENSHTLKVDRAREVMDTINLMPYQSPYRVALMLRFQEASEGTQNAMLKTLEEAPSRSVLILTASSPEDLRPTVVSRCEVLRLRPVSVERLESELIQRGWAQEEAHLYAHLSGGRMGYALTLKEEAGQFEKRVELMENWLGMLGQNRIERFAYADKLTRSNLPEVFLEPKRDELRLAYATWLSAWRDVMLASANPGLPLVNVDYESSIRSLAERMGWEQARQQVRNMERGLARIDANVNMRLLTENILLDWPRVSAE